MGHGIRACRVLFTGAAIYCGLCALPAYALKMDVMGYLKRYQLGIDRSVWMSTMDISYETSWGYGHPDCKRNDSDWKNTCSASLGAGTSTGWGFFLQQPFKRQNLFYFDYDLGFSVKSYEAHLPSSASDARLPLRSLDAQLYGMTTRGYIKVGLTPSNWIPDLFLTAGKGFQFVTGKVTVNGASQWSSMLNRIEDSFYFELELVFLRFRKTGELSLFATIDTTGSPFVGEFFSKKLESMDDLKAKFNQNGYGIRLLLP